jgi:hypothetical protein
VEEGKQALKTASERFWARGVIQGGVLPAQKGSNGLESLSGRLSKTACIMRTCVDESPTAARLPGFSPRAPGFVAHPYAVARPSQEGGRAKGVRGWATHLAFEL